LSLGKSISKASSNNVTAAGRRAPPLCVVFLEYFPMPRSVSALRIVLGVCETEGNTAMSDESIILINMLKVEPDKQDALIALLKQNTHTMVCTLNGWKTTRLIAAKDGAGVVIYSEWETPAAFEAMRSDPRMKAYLPKIIELASVDSIVGSAVLSETR
jgi:heme-degrading monooxygenase HmoA